MTRQRALKRLIRERMAQTGERYAAARRHFLKDTGGETRESGRPDPGGSALRGGLYPETASLASVAADAGVVSPVDGRPFSEAMVLGLSGGLGAGYILWEFKSDARLDRRRIVTLGFARDWQYPERWTLHAAARLGIALKVERTSSATAATKAMDAAFAAGRRPIAWVDRMEQGTWPMPEAWSGYGGYPVVLLGRAEDDPGVVLVDERGRTPLRVPVGRLAAARGRIYSYRNMLFVPDWVEPLTIDDLRARVREAIAESAEHLMTLSDSFGLAAWTKWSRMLTDRRNAKAWPRVFADGVGLYGALLSVGEAIDGSLGPGGGHLRGLYAAFLGEAAALLDDERLETAARRWQEAADLWEDLSDAVVPADLPDGLEAIEALEAIHAAVMEGEPGRAASSEAGARYWAILERHALTFPSSDERRDEHFADLAARLRAIHDAEVVARDAMAVAAR